MSGHYFRHSAGELDRERQVVLHVCHFSLCILMSFTRFPSGTRAQTWPEKPAQSHGTPGRPLASPSPSNIGKGVPPYASPSTSQGFPPHAASFSPSPHGMPSSASPYTPHYPHSQQQQQQRAYFDTERSRTPDTPLGTTAKALSFPPRTQSPSPHLAFKTAAASSSLFGDSSSMSALLPTPVDPVRISAGPSSH